MPIPATNITTLPYRRDGNVGECDKEYTYTYEQDTCTKEVKCRATCGHNLLMMQTSPGTGPAHAGDRTNQGPETDRVDDDPLRHRAVDNISTESFTTAINKTVDFTNKVRQQMFDRKIRQKYVRILLLV